MPRILYVTTDLPYFPGQGGLMPLHLQYLSRSQFTGVVGPRYPHQPEDALQRLRDTVQRSYWWPEHPEPGEVPASQPPIPSSAVWIKFLPRSLRLRLLRQLTGLGNYSDEAMAWHIAIAQLAPKLLEALRAEHWNVVLLAQSTSAAWMRFLPSSMARCLYFHDVRADYLGKSPTPPNRGNLRRVLLEEQRAVREVDTLAFVSQHDLVRAEKLLTPPCPVAVAPICIDTEYFGYHPPAENSDPIVLFTGHLSHPPNVDAAVYFLSTIWPKITSAWPAARLKIVGLQPAQEVTAAVQGTQNVELIANVPDIRPYFRNARVYVVPIRYGGGVRQKILEAWAVGLPVVSTHLGADGIEAAGPETCWLQDDPSAFAAQTVELLRQPPPSAVLAKARQCVVDHYSQAVSSPVLEKQIAIAVKRRREAPARILYDLRWLREGKVGGVEQMTHELINEIASFDHTNEYRFFGRKASLDRWQFPAGFRQKSVYVDEVADQKRARRAGLINALAESVSLPHLATQELTALEIYTQLDFTVVHGLAGLVHPSLRQFPSVVTVHDLQHLDLPEFFTAEDIATREREYRASCQAASHVICVSEFTRQAVHRHYGIPLEKLSAIWNLPPKRNAPLGRSAANRLLETMGVKAPFLFFPAQPWAHKNHLRLLQAIQLLDDSWPRDYSLILTGQPLPATHRAAELLANLAARKRVQHLGYRTAAEIDALYESAEAMIFPSLFEGFGLPLIEAMQHRCPIICGRHTSIPEIAGEAALFTDVTSAEKIAEAVLRITRDTDLRATLKLRGTENLRRFDRRALAEKTRAIYRSVHERHFT